VYWLWNVKRNS